MDVVGSGDGVFLFLGGDLGERSAPLLARVLEALDAQRPESLWIELAGLDHADPAGLQVLFDARVRAERHGYEFLLRSPSRAVADLLERVVTKEIADEVVAAGVPARILREVGDRTAPTLHSR